MKMIIVVALAFVAVAVAAPAETPVPPQIVRSEFVQQLDGAYVSSFETENGIKQQETGEVKEIVGEDNKPQKVVIVRGSYSYTNPDGKTETVNYIADENGFKAEGDSIPTPPAVRR